MVLSLLAPLVFFYLCYRTLPAADVCGLGPGQLAVHFAIEHVDKHILMCMVFKRAEETFDELWGKCTTEPREL